ncbi:MAG TPA: hypothetical protein VI997_05505, partial [Candidatus Thermoplasmatota archaeon]|nr:hypothetical protein [Candidatus Thermoplasmatota archaeon]
MRGTWKPFVTYGATFGAVVGYFLFARGGFTDALGYVVVPLAVLPFVALALVQGIVPVRHFLQGLAEGGESLDIVSDDVGWFGGRTVVVRGARGEWRIEATSGKQARLEVRAPDASEPTRVRGSARKAGRREAERVLLSSARETPPSPPSRTEPSRAQQVALAAAVVAAVAAVLVAKAGAARGAEIWPALGLAAAVA